MFSRFFLVLAYRLAMSEAFVSHNYFDTIKLSEYMDFFYLKLT